jgi:putative DNA primase/helicase
MTSNSRNPKDYPNWCVWADKTQPQSALTGLRTNWQQDLATYAEAKEYCDKNEGFKLGFSFSKDAPFVGLDFDSCVTSKGDTADWATEFVSKLFPNLPDKLFFDTSVSGTGFKIILYCPQELKRGVLLLEDEERIGDHVPQVELFTNSKYFALTGEHESDFELPLVTASILSRVFTHDLVPVVQVDRPTSSGGDTPASELKSYLDLLDVTDYDGRDTWLPMMQAAHHATGGSDEGLEVFSEWSKGDSAQYNESHLNRDWNSLDPNTDNPVTIATIIRDIPIEDRPRRSPEDDFDKVESAKPVVGRTVLCELLSVVDRNHTTVAGIFAEENHSTVRYVTDWNKWIVFTGVDWRVDLAGKMVQGQVQRFIRSLQDRIPDDPDHSEECGKALQWVGQLGNWSNTSGVMKQACGFRELSITSDDLQLKPHLLNLRNGTLNLVTKELQPHDPADLIMGFCNTDYIEDAKCPVWIKVLNDIFNKDKDLINYVQKLLGYAISGTTELEIFPVAYGGGCNGKSTVVQTLARLLGSYAVHLPSEMFNAKMELHPTYFAALKGARLAAVAELESNIELSESTVKKITSQDRIEARRMREDPWMFDPTHTTLLCTNHKPKVKGSDEGIWRRLKLIPFTVDLTDFKDTTVPERLIGEYAGILNWLVEGHTLYKQEGLEDCEAVLLATKEYRENEDTFQIFLEEMVETDHGGSVGVSESFIAYTRQGGRLGKKNFISEMERCGHMRSRKRVGDSRPFVFTGIKLLIVSD